MTGALVVGVVLGADPAGWFPFAVVKWWWLLATTAETSGERHIAAAQLVDGVLTVTAEVYSRDGRSEESTTEVFRLVLAG
ncbi:MAG: hypothetical protein P8N02_09915 [Actinomycetota bacterium]|nr:hypothetical protein [Actinomycetota bacterium]